MIKLSKYLMENRWRIAVAEMRYMNLITHRYEMIAYLIGVRHGK
jgi:hypothetical protein